MDYMQAMEFLAGKGFREYEAKYLAPQLRNFLSNGNNHIVGKVRRKFIKGTVDAGEFRVTFDLHLPPWGENRPPVKGRGVLRWRGGKFTGKMKAAKC